MHFHSIQTQEYNGLLWAKSGKQVEEGELSTLFSTGEATCSHIVARPGLPSTKEIWIHWNNLCGATKVLYVLYYPFHMRRG